MSRQRFKTPLVRFMEKVKMPDPDDPKQCWIWQGAFYNYNPPRGKRRPLLCVGSNRYPATHIALLLLKNGRRVPPHSPVWTWCGDPRCVNPEHLFEPAKIKHRQTNTWDRRLIRAIRASKAQYSMPQMAAAFKLPLEDIRAILAATDHTLAAMEAARAAAADQHVTHAIQPHL